MLVYIRQRGGVPMQERALRGRVALVARATRRAGRGIACMQGEAGATVYCSGRSTREHPCVTGFYAGRPETIDETGDGDILDYRSTLFYDLIKFSVTRFAFAMAEELHKDRVAAVAVTPGFMRTESSWRSRRIPRSSKNRVTCTVPGSWRRSMDSRMWTDRGPTLVSTLIRSNSLFCGRRPSFAGP